MTSIINQGLTQIAEVGQGIYTCFRHPKESYHRLVAHSHYCFYSAQFKLTRYCIRPIKRRINACLESREMKKAQCATLFAAAFFCPEAITVVGALHVGRAVSRRMEGPTLPIASVLIANQVLKALPLPIRGTLLCRVIAPNAFADLLRYYVTDTIKELWQNCFSQSD